VFPKRLGSVADMHDPSQQDPRQAQAVIETVACKLPCGAIRTRPVHVNGAGLAMATMDMIKHAGPANFLDVGTAGVWFE
jgi:malate-CoA ligase subunit beta